MDTLLTGMPCISHYSQIMLCMFKRMTHTTGGLLYLLIRFASASIAGLVDCIAL